MFELLRSQPDGIMLLMIIVIGLLSWMLILCGFILYDNIHEWAVKKRKIARRKNELYRKYGSGEVRVYDRSVKRSVQRRK